MGRPREHFTCTVDGCGKLHRARGLCDRHYQAWRTATKPQPIERVADCSVADCTRPSQSRGMCHAHYSRWFRTGSVGGAAIGNYKSRQSAHYAWLGEGVSYIGAHRRILNARGAASGYDCDECGLPALDWAYIHDSPGERYDIRTRRPFSSNPVHYRPLCRSCHKHEHATLLSHSA